MHLWLIGCIPSSIEVKLGYRFEGSFPYGSGNKTFNWVNPELPIEFERTESSLDIRYLTYATVSETV